MKMRVRKNLREIDLVRGIEYIPSREGDIVEVELQRQFANGTILYHENDRRRTAWYSFELEPATEFANEEVING
jgi:hypothetical protein